MNLYRGCTHGCVYCDGRDEKYAVKGEFDRDIEIKSNAVEVLRSELHPSRKRKPLRKGFIFAGGGINDCFQPVEKQYHLTLKVLQMLREYKYPVHLLTKSADVSSYTDVLHEINQQKKAIISFSFSTVDDKLARIFEPHASSPTERLETISLLRKQGFTCGACLMPVIPLISDIPEKLDQSFHEIKKAGADFIIPAGLTLKDGRQKTFFINNVRKHFPKMVKEYEHIYLSNRRGNPTNDHVTELNQRFYHHARKYNIPLRMPQAIYDGFIDETDKIIVILEHMDYLLRLTGKKSPFGYAAYSISKLSHPVREIASFLKQITGVDSRSAAIIKEILATGTSTHYLSLMNYKSAGYW